MIKSLLVVSVLFFAASGYSKTLSCRLDVDSRTEQIIAIADGANIICEGRKGTDFNHPTVRQNQCAAGMTLITNSGSTPTNKGTEFTLVSQVMSSALNDFTTDLVYTVKYTVPSRSNGKDISATLEITSAVGAIVGSKVVVSKALNISLNKNISLNNCSLK